MLHRLSRSKYVIENSHDTRSFISNVNTSITRKCNNNISTIFFKYAAQQRHTQHANGSPPIEIWIDPSEAIQQSFILSEGEN